MKGSAAIGRVVCVATYALLIWFVGSHLGEFGGYSGLIEQLPEGYDKLSAMPSQEIIAWALGGALSSVVLQSALQPMLAAKDDKTARNGCILGYVIAAPICILTAVIGMMARAKNDGLGDGATAFAWAIRDMSSPVTAGIIFAVCTMIIAATMATMMMATGTILTNIYKKQIRPDADDRKVSRIFHSICSDDQPVFDFNLCGNLSVQLFCHRRAVLETGKCSCLLSQCGGRNYHSCCLGCSRNE